MLPSVACCGRSRVGFDLELGGPARRLPRCPVAYTRDNEIAYAVGNQILVGDRVVWDTRCGLHRVQPWDWDEPRVMLHTRISGDPLTEGS